MFRSEDDGFVSGDGGHGGERVHGLGASDAGDEFDGEQSGSCLDCREERGGIVEWAEETDRDGSALEVALVLRWGGR